jgi:anti-anti-sigma regulatory factor
MKPVFTVQLIWQLDQITIPEYHKSINELIINNENPFVLLLEMWEVSYINSTAIWYIADWYNSISEKWWDTTIIWAKENIKDTLEIVWIASRVNLYDTLDEFKESFKKEQTWV